MSEKNELDNVIFIMRQMVKNQETMNETLTDLVNMFKKYDMEEVIYSEELRED